MGCLLNVCAMIDSMAATERLVKLTGHSPSSCQPVHWYCAQMSPCDSTCSSASMCLDAWPLDGWRRKRHQHKLGNANSASALTARKSSQQKIAEWIKSCSWEWCVCFIFLYFSIQSNNPTIVRLNPMIQQQNPRIQTNNELSLSENMQHFETLTLSCIMYWRFLHSGSTHLLIYIYIYTFN